MKWSRLRWRISVRALVLLVAGIAVALAATTNWIPNYLWQRRVQRTIDEKLSVYDQLRLLRCSTTTPLTRDYGITADEMADLMRDPRLVADRLIHVIETEIDDERRQAALGALSAMLHEVGTPELVAYCVSLAARGASSCELPPEVEQHLLGLVGTWARYVGVESQARAALRERAYQVFNEQSRSPNPEDQSALVPPDNISSLENWLSSIPPDSYDPGSGANRSPDWPPGLPSPVPPDSGNPGFRSWIGTLALIGGRPEGKILFSLDDHPDPDLRGALGHRHLRDSRWPGLLPYLKAWLDDPKLAPLVIDYEILANTVEGRELLVDVVLDRSRPVELRKRMFYPNNSVLIHGLFNTYAGLDLLESVLADEHSETVLAELIDWARPPDLAIENKREAITHSTNYHFWLHMVGCLKSHWETRLKRLYPKIDDDEEFQQLVEQRINTTIEVMQALAGRPDLISVEQWETFLEDQKPAVDRGELLALFAQRLELLEHDSIRQWIDLGSIGTMPQDWIPHYVRIAREGPEPARHLAIEMLLFYTDRTDEVPILLDLIERDRDRPSLARERNPKLIETLRRRFAVNHGWDVEAWRSWWAETRGREIAA